MRLSQLLARELSPDVSDVDISGMRLDSRFIRSGDVFFGLPGLDSDGRLFIEQAIVAGAHAVVYEAEDGFSPQLSTTRVPVIGVHSLRSKLAAYARRFYRLPSQDSGLIGITGTNGKTSIALIVQQMLRDVDRHCGYVGTLGFGHSLSELSGSSLTTPDICTLYGQISQFINDGSNLIAIEASSHALDQGRMQGLFFDYAVFSNLSRDHFDYHRGFAEYFDAKRKLFDMCRTAIVNIDDQYGRQLVEQLSKHKTVLSYSISGAGYGSYTSFAHASQCVLSASGISFVLHCGNQSITCTTGLLGSFSISNILAASCVLIDMGYSLEQLAHAIEQLVTPSGRLERVADNPAVFIDYAHTPDALSRALIELQSMVFNRVFVVFGCGGDRDNGKRPLMGVNASRYADRVFITNDNPRSESPQKIIDQILSDIPDREMFRVTANPDRARAIAQAISEAGGDDCVLVAGKGHETGQVIGDAVIAYSDHDTVARLVAQAP